MDASHIQKIEEKILKFWKDRDIFRRSLDQRKDNKRFVFFEGPPTANGRPGIHHFIGRTYKDLFARYKTMRGYYVERKAGWDTQGIPVELEIEKKLGLKSKKDIEAYGIAQFNALAKESVWQYTQEWKKFTERIGYWINLEDPYITYEATYIETLWWIIEEFDKRKLLFEGHKVLPWCTRCGTALSSHEVAQEYQDVTETSVYVKFQITDGQSANGYKLKANTYLIAWTTTPWTLPGNVALAINEKIEYVHVEHNQEHFIVAKDRVQSIFGEQIKIIRQFKGNELVGLGYEPLFSVKPLHNKKSHKIYGADFVTTTDGTGIVHTAVMYGEDDYELGKKIGLPMHHTVTAEGVFTDDVKEFAGRYVKEAEPDIVEYLKAKSYLLKAEPYTHSYPFCWRCKTPLLYYARNSWFVGMSKLRKQLVKQNSKVHWYPDNLKEGRFGEFIKEAKDWAFSRERYWGTPLPIWKCQSCNAKHTVGSLDELNERRYEQSNTYYLVRHGWSENNNEDAVSGIHSSDITRDHYGLRPQGKDQVEKIAEQLAREGVDFIYTSPFQRTRETAEIISKKTGIKIHIDDRLREINDLDDGEAYSHEKGNHTSTDLDAARPGGESLRAARRRMVAFMAELERNHQNKKIVVVSHGHPLWMLATFIENVAESNIIKTKSEFYTSQGMMRTARMPNYPINTEGELDMHRPFVDELFIACPQCSKKMTRIPEVADVWFDSGGMPLAQWHYPFENKQQFKANYPADFICEAIDQTRGWFYSLLAVATALKLKAPYKNVISYSHVLDDKGKKMSKSLGNIVVPDEVMAQTGADAARWYFCIVNQPGDTKLFALRDVELALRGFIMSLLNSLNFFELYADKQIAHMRIAAQPVNILDHWILSRLNSVIHTVSQNLEAYDYTTASRSLQSFMMDDVSNWWLRRSRSRFQRPDNPQNLRKVSHTLQYILVEVAKLAAPFIPFVADHLYKSLSNKKESVHLEDWPQSHAKLIKPELETAMINIRLYVAQGLALRKAANIKVRQPLQTLTLHESIDEELKFLLQEEVNVKDVAIDPTQSEPVILKTEISRPLYLEGLAREISRQIQDLRKEVGYRVDENIRAYWSATHADIRETFKTFTTIIARDTALSMLEEGTKSESSYEIKKEFELGPHMKLILGLSK